MKHVLYEVTSDFDIIIKLSFDNYTYLNAFIEQHTADKKYEPKFLVLEVNDEGDIDFIRTYNGTKEVSKKNERSTFKCNEIAALSDNH
jgi:hypothetical protein